MISLNCVLDKGQYVVLLSTYDPDQFGKFSFTLWYPKGSVSAQRGRPRLSLERLAKHGKSG